MGIQQITSRTIFSVAFFALSFSACVQAHSSGGGAAHSISPGEARSDDALTRSKSNAEATNTDSVIAGYERELERLSSERKAVELAAEPDERARLCERQCSISENTCKLKDEVCKHDDPRYDKTCRRAKDDCAKATSRCHSCPRKGVAFWPVGTDTNDKSCSAI